MIPERFFYRPLPELSSVVPPILEWAATVKDEDYICHGAKPGYWYVPAPDELAELSNQCISINLKKYNNGVPVFHGPTTVKMGGLFPNGYHLHTDSTRESAVNILLTGDPLNSRTEWVVDNQVVSCPYQTHQPVIFNTQFPHRVSILNNEERIIFSMKVTVSFQRFCNLVSRNLLVFR